MVNSSNPHLVRLALIESHSRVGVAAAEIVKVLDALPVPQAFVAVMPTDPLNAAVGTPLISPVEVLTERPAGRPEAP